MKSTRSEPGTKSLQLRVLRLGLLLQLHAARTRRFLQTSDFDGGQQYPAAEFKGRQSARTGCDEPHVGEEARVPDTADYVFYESKLAH